MRKRQEYDLCGNIPIGYVGENESREIVLDIGPLMREWPELTPQLVAKRPGETDVYPCITRLEGDLLIWTVTDSDTAIPGMGEVRVHMVGKNGEIAKSRIAQTVIGGGMEGEMQKEPPPAIKPWIDQILQAGGGAKLDVIEDTEVLGALAENDLMLAVGSDEGVLCDEDGNILEW